MMKGFITIYQKFLLIINNLVTSRGNVDEVMNLSFIVIYLVVPILGVALNFYVFARLIRVARANAVRFETTSALPLCAMSVSDSVCLLAEFSQVVFHWWIVRAISDADQKANRVLVFTFFCKANIFLMHTTSAFSVWSWLVLSILRYTAVFHPLKYRTIWRQPRDALKLLVVVCSLCESWILLVVVYFPSDNKGPAMCAENPSIDQHTIKMAHLMDICMFYAVPAMLRIFFDGIVLFHCYSPYGTIDEPPSLYERRYAISLPSMERRMSTTENDFLNSGANMALVVSMAQCAGQQMTKKRQLYQKRRQAMIMRSITISALNLLCNLPHHIHRTWLTLMDGDLQEQQVESEFSKYIESITQVLYFSQFACNAFYLSTSIYETTAHTRHAILSSGPKTVTRIESRDDE
ncbi:unnamed protein product, partial [Mesorhabditis belari]|uniref:G-protein coupled receptors family 1 profile domain-containing protein n=1 Tax=Mesorhabditis belari TaxID=2138241 RepID=A0AAF3ESJ6_9BILA